MKVYVVLGCDYDGSWIEKIFYKKDVAQEFCDNKKLNNQNI